jgi:hypothetical protein
MGKVDDPVEPSLKTLDRVAVALQCAITFGRLKLQLQRGQRRAQLVGRVGNEDSLRLRCVVQTSQQVVQCIDQWTNLHRHPRASLQWFKRVERAPR